MNDLAKDTPFEEIAEKGAAIYDRDKSMYEPAEHGKFLAIEVESEKKYLADSTAEALIQAREENPGKIFYVVKIGFSTVESIAQSLLGRI